MYSTVGIWRIDELDELQVWGETRPIIIKLKFTENLQINEYIRSWQQESEDKEIFVNWLSGHDEPTFPLTEYWNIVVKFASPMRHTYQVIHQC